LHYDTKELEYFLYPAVVTHCIGQNFRNFLEALPKSIFSLQLPRSYVQCSAYKGSMENIVVQFNGEFSTISATF
jgi:hypothetical protein